MFCVLNFKASEIFRDLTVLLRHFSKPIFQFSDENILIATLFSNRDFAGYSITDDLGRNSLKRGKEQI